MFECMDYLIQANPSLSKKSNDFPGKPEPTLRKLTTDCNEVCFMIWTFVSIGSRDKEFRGRLVQSHFTEEETETQERIF